MTRFDVRIHGDAVRFSVRLQPRASKNEIDGVQNGALRVKVTAPPADGAANEAMVGLLAKALDTARRNVTIVGGAASRNKTVEVSGLTADRVINLAR